MKPNLQGSSFYTILYQISRLFVFKFWDREHTQCCSGIIFGSAHRNYMVVLGRSSQMLGIEHGSVDWLQGKCTIQYSVFLALCVIPNRQFSNKLSRHLLPENEVVHRFLGARNYPDHICGVQGPSVKHLTVLSCLAMPWFKLRLTPGKPDNLPLSYISGPFTSF